MRLRILGSSKMHLSRISSKGGPHRIESIVQHDRCSFNVSPARAFIQMDDGHGQLPDFNGKGLASAMTQKFLLVVVQNRLRFVLHPTDCVQVTPTSVGNGCGKKS